MMTKEQSQALDHIMRAHYAPAFIKRCADRGLQIEDEAHLQELLETTAQVKMAQEQMGGSEQRQVTSQAAHQLNVALHGEEKAAEIAVARQQSFAPPVEPTELSDETKQALATLLASPVAEDKSASE